MNKILIALGIFCCIASQVYSQAPGYRGYTLGVYYEGYIFPALNRPNGNFTSSYLLTYKYDHENAKTNFLAMNYRHCLGIEYTISRKQTIGGAFHFYKTSTYLSERFEYEEEPFDRRNSANVQGINDFVGINGKDFEIFYKNTFSEFIAPVGTFMKISLMGISAHVLADDPIEVTANTQNGEKDILIEFPDTRFFYPGIAYEMGGTRIVFDRAEIRLGVQVMFIPTNLTYTDSRVQFETYLKNAAGLRLFHMHAVNLKMGIGFLAK